MERLGEKFEEKVCREAAAVFVCSAVMLVFVTLLVLLAQRMLTTAHRSWSFFCAFIVCVCGFFFLGPG